MITTHFDNDTLQIVLTPNRSASWKQNCQLLLALGAVVLLIASVWSYMGVWMILPFAGLELGFLSYFVYRTSQRSYLKEVVYLLQDTIKIERGQTAPITQLSYPKDLCEFVIQKPKHYWSPAELNLVHRNENVVLGRFLSKKDMDELTEIIKDTGLKYRIRGRTLVEKQDPFNL